MSNLRNLKARGILHFICRRQDNGFSSLASATEPLLWELTPNPPEKATWYSGDSSLPRGVTSSVHIQTIGQKATVRWVCFVQ